jgi:SAM-dependent methyltransferase
MAAASEGREELTDMSCVICNQTEGTQHVFREMMFGTRDQFVYWECASCGCLQIVSIPERLADYYPNEYYSFSQCLTTLTTLLYRAYFKAPSLARLIRPAGVTFQSVIDAKPKPGARILDVGCGAGKLVTVLRSMGFDAYGTDPFVKVETPYVRRAPLEDAESGWDLIMFHHSLEHMVNHVSVLRCAREKLANDGMCLVRIPIANWAWQHYGKDWVQLDAPRHLVIHTRKSFCRASELAGLRPTTIVFDSIALQFYGSELYKQDIPLKDEGARFDKRTLEEFAARAKELNRQELGDQASFYLKPSLPGYSSEDYCYGGHQEQNAQRRETIRG